MWIAPSPPADAIVKRTTVLFKTYDATVPFEMKVLNDPLKSYQEIQKTVYIDFSVLLISCH